MKYLIKTQRDDCYFSGFNPGSGKLSFGEIREAKIYDDKYSALYDLRKMEHCGQRIIAVTRIGKSRHARPKNIVKEGK